MWTQCWLNYNESKENSQIYADYFSCIYVDGFKKDHVIVTAKDELSLASKALFDKEIEIDISDPVKGIVFKKGSEEKLTKEGYRIYADGKVCYIEAATSQAVIYGTFRFLNLIRLGEFNENTDITEIPKNPIRMLDHWDNMDGSIERGYSGNSFFFVENDVVIASSIQVNGKYYTVTTINADAFDTSSVVESITIPSSVNMLGDDFVGNSHIKSINVQSGNKTFKSVDGVLFDYSGDTLIKYPPAKDTIEEYWVPSNTKVIGSNAFHNVGYVKKVIFDGELIAISESAFTHCPNLKSWVFLSAKPPYLMGYNTFTIYDDTEFYYQFNKADYNANLYYYKYILYDFVDCFDNEITNKILLQGLARIKIYQAEENQHKYHICNINIGDKTDAHDKWKALKPSLTM